MKYAREGNDTKNHLSKKLNKNEFNALKQSLPVLPKQERLSNILTNTNEITDCNKNKTVSIKNNVSYKLNDPYFYKNVAGINMKQEHNYRSKIE